MRIILTALLTLGFFLVAHPSGAIVINEINFDPGTDANGDGILVGSEDEYVELVNETEFPVDIGDWEVADAGGTRFTFPSGIYLGPGEAVVVFGGGDLGSFTACQAYQANGVLSLNNSGDTVRILDNTATEIVAYTYTSPTPDISLTRYPDVTGSEPLVAHDSVSALVCSPGTQVDGSPFPISGPTTWYRDFDNDGWGDDLDTVLSVTQPAGYVDQGGDCDDDDDTVYPGAIELCGDGKDNDCDNVTDELCFNVIINEINYDPGEGDPNQDGYLDIIEDEFVELVNVSGGVVDLEGWTLSDGIMVRHVFSPVSIPDGGPIVVFGGGALDGFTACPAQVASESSMFGLSLNNAGGTVTLKNPGGAVIATYTYDGSIADVSITRYPDVTGPEPFVAHDTVSPDPFSPGLRVDGSPILQVPVEWFRDQDEDGYGDEGDAVWAVNQPAGYVATGGDCDDDDDTVYPGAQEICGDGKDNNCDTVVDEGCVVFEILSVIDVGNDQGRQVRVRWSGHENDAAGEPAPIISYSLYRRIDGNKDLDTSGWDFLVNVPAATQTGYSAVAPTLCDSTDAGICWSVFAVRAHTDSPGAFFDTEPDSGYSIDNLAPSPPGSPLVASGTLSWDEPIDPDVRYVTVYGSATGVLDGSEVVIGHATATDLDVSGAAHAYYLLTATDFAGNEGAAVAVSSGLSDVPGAHPARTALLGNHPNPFNPATVIEYELAMAMPVRLVVYDLSGRLVRSLENGTVKAAGRNESTWDGRNGSGRLVPAGVYFYRLEAGDFRGTGRMALVK